jgi:hypothetical protein
MRPLGFPNLVRAREQRSLNAFLRLEEKLRQPPLVVVLKCPCGRVRHVEDFSELTPDELRIVRGLLRDRKR